MTASNITLSEKYENGILKGKYVNSARVISGIFIMFICNFIVNPNNEPQNLRSKNGDYFFMDNVSEKYSTFLICYSLLAVVSFIIPAVFIVNPINYNSKFLKFLKSLVGFETLEFE